MSADMQRLSGCSDRNTDLCLNGMSPGLSIAGRLISSTMPCIGSYLWRLRQAIGDELVLMPGAMIALRRPDGKVLLTRRADDGTWFLPAGAAEPGGSFAATATDELKEETGVVVAEGDLIPFGCLSEAEAHTIHYPNSDVTHCFALLFMAERWTGDPRPDYDESVDSRFVDWRPAPAHPQPDHSCTRGTERLPRLGSLPSAVGPVALRRRRTPDAPSSSSRRSGARVGNTSAGSRR